MSRNLTVEAPNFEKIAEEAGQFTSDAISLLWLTLNLTRQEQRAGERHAIEMLAPKVLTLSPSASVNNLDLQGCSVVHFTGGTQNFTGMRAPETGKSRVIIAVNTGGGTITVKHNLTSESQNQISTKTAGDVTLTAAVFISLPGGTKWLEVAQ